MQAFPRELVKDSKVATLQQRPKGFNTVRVCHAANILPNRVIHALMFIIGQSEITLMAVSVERRPDHDICLNEIVERFPVSVRGHLGLHLAVPFTSPNDRLLPTVPLPAFSLLLACLLCSLLPKYVSSASTMPFIGPPVSPITPATSRSRPSMNHAVF